MVKGFLGEWVEIQYYLTFTNNIDLNNSSTDEIITPEENFVMPEELILDDGKSVVKSTTPNTVERYAVAP